MMKYRRWICCLLIISLVLSGLSGCGDSGGEYAELLERTARATAADMQGELLSDPVAFPVGTCDWLAVACSMAGIEADYDAYLASLSQFVAQKYAQGSLELERATFWSRTALTVLVLGGDPTAFSVGADGAPINLLRDGVYEYAWDLPSQGANCLAYALIALDAGEYETPQGCLYDRQNLLQMLCSMQAQDGGFGLSVGSSDVDITAMVLQAFAPYTEQPEIAAAVEEGLLYLSAQMNTDGTYVSGCESVAQLMIALCALGIDPDQDKRFCRSDTCPSETLLRFQAPDGRFAHELGQAEGNLLSTEQAMLAFIALQKYRTQGSALFADVLSSAAK